MPGESIITLAIRDVTGIIMKGDFQPILKYIPLTATTELTHRRGGHFY